MKGEEEERREQLYRNGEREVRKREREREKKRMKINSRVEEH